MILTRKAPDNFGRGDRLLGVGCWYQERKGEKQPCAVFLPEQGGS